MPPPHKRIKHPRLCEITIMAAGPNIAHLSALLTPFLWRLRSLCSQTNSYHICVMLLLFTPSHHPKRFTSQPGTWSIWLALMVSHPFVNTRILHVYMYTVSPISLLVCCLLHRWRSLGKIKHSYKSGIYRMMRPSSSFHDNLRSSHSCWSQDSSGWANWWLCDTEGVNRSARSSFG